MTGAAVVAGVAGACAVGATWELLATVERTRASERMTRLLAPLRRPQHAATATEQRRLARTAVGVLLAAGWLLAGPRLTGSAQRADQSVGFHRARAGRKH